MNIPHLANLRAETMARLEMLTAIGLDVSEDVEEERELRLALAKARAEYQAAEGAYQSAISTLTQDELRALGVTP